MAVVAGAAGVVALQRGLALDYDFDDSWADSHRFVAHALGGIDSRSYTNSREAFVRNYGLGFRVFEVDLDFTADGRLVAVHDWPRVGTWASTSPPSLEQFSSSKILGEYSGLTASDLIALLGEHADAYLILDTKNEALAVWQSFVQTARESRPDVLDRVVPQLYDSDIRSVLAIHPFRSLTLTLYRTGADDGRVLSFVEWSGVGVVTMPRERATEPFVRRLADLGVRVFVHTVNDPAQADELMRIGVHGVYTDFIAPGSLGRGS